MEWPESSEWARDPLGGMLTGVEAAARERSEAKGRVGRRRGVWPAGDFGVTDQLLQGEEQQNPSRIALLPSSTLHE